MRGAFSKPALGAMFLLVAGALSPSLAQQRAAAADAAAPLPAATSSAAGQPELLTAKERLGEKWMDDQRVNNCKVPPDKRGSKPRPDGCSNVLTGMANRSDAKSRAR
jgi:hypothetical protein